MLMALLLAFALQDSLKEDFEKDNPKWTFSATGKWERKASGEMAQTGVAEPWTAAVLADKAFGDVKVSFCFKLVSGQEDQTAGILFRAKDVKTYYLARVNALEGNFRLYTMTDDKRKQLASAKVEPPALGEWHTIQVVAQGPKIQAWLNGTLVLEHEDATFASGYVGLWTKADAVTEFDDLEAKAP